MHPAPFLRWFGNDPPNVKLVNLTPTFRIFEDEQKHYPSDPVLWIYYKMMRNLLGLSNMRLASQLVCVMEKGMNVLDRGSQQNESDEYTNSALKSL